MTISDGQAHPQFGYVQQLLGEWDIVYPDDGAIADGATRERLVVRGDGTYTWHPAPEWAKPVGRWAVRIEPDLDDAMVLGFESKIGAPRCHVLILVRMPATPLYWVWQRTLAVIVHPDGREEIDRNTVLFSERVLLARQPERLYQGPT